MGATQSTDHGHILNTPLGKLKGTEQRDSSGNPVCRRYLKIPYAQPPVGQLRWRRPQPLPQPFSFNTSSDTPGDYTSFGPICPQPYYPTDKAFVPNPNAAPPVSHVQSEDCLYLNVWVPCGPPPAGGWPVQFHIHGGWLQVGNANQGNDADPFDLLASSTPRIIVAATYRLNLFGFLGGADLASLAEDPAPSNYGFWDQRAALEWTAAHIRHFNGNADNITVGGLSAGANSAWFQLYYDAHRPAGQRLIKRVYLWSNAVAIQPAPSASASLTSQLNELCTANYIPSSLLASEKLSRLRSIPASELVASLSRLNMHTFRASTDDAFIPSTFLRSLHDGTFTTLLAKHNTSILAGEVRDEYQLYKYVNPPHDHASLIVQLTNYYPEPIVTALLNSNLYPIPSPPTASSSSTTTTPGTPDDYATVFAKIVADVQVHSSLRFLTHSLLSPPSAPGIYPLPAANFHRYKINWRAGCMDAWLKPEVGLCHASDTPIWWMSGSRCGWMGEDRENVRGFLESFGRFLEGGDGKGGAGLKAVRVFDESGVTKENVVDEDWERGLSVARVVWAAQERSVMGGGGRASKL